MCTLNYCNVADLNDNARVENKKLSSAGTTCRERHTVSIMCQCVECQDLVSTYVCQAQGGCAHPPHPSLLELRSAQCAGARTHKEGRKHFIFIIFIFHFWGFIFFQNKEKRARVGRWLARGPCEEGTCMQGLLTRTVCVRRAQYNLTSN